MTLKIKVNDCRIQYQSRESWCIYGVNLEILAEIHYKLLHGQVQFPRILSQNGQNDQGQGQWPLFSTPAKSIPWCMFGANLDKVKFTDGRTDTSNDNRPLAWNLLLTGCSPSQPIIQTIPGTAQCACSHTTPGPKKHCRRFFLYDSIKINVFFCVSKFFDLMIRWHGLYDTAMENLSDVSK